MSLYKRGGVYWSYIWQNGVRHAKSTGSSKIRAAEDFDRKHKIELEFQKFRPPELSPEMPFGELFARFLADGEVKDFHIGRSKIFLPYFAEMPIGEITKNELIRYRKERHRQKKLTDTTINRDIEVIRHVLFWAVEERILASNPLARLRLPRARRIKRPIMSLEEEERLLSVSAPHLKKIIICGLDTGMRRGEILSQRFEHLDFVRKVLMVTKSKTAGGESREIPLTSRLFQLLSDDKKNKGEIFTFGDKPIMAVKTAWHSAVRKAGIRHFRFKDLRTSFNSRLIEAGVIKDVRMELMGHSRNDDTNDLYSQIELPLLREAISKLEYWREQQMQNTRKEENEQTAKRPTDPSADASSPA
ncbi:MAG TPA: site-specific integrase [Candidatus Angelobacter sp.]|nr:site-specific integrase [Candidatus Angelobacter sp.]